MGSLTPPEVSKPAPAAPPRRAEEPMYELIELFFFAYRDFVADADRLLEAYGFGRAHHRVLYFVSRRPGLTIAELLEILRITKQSLNRVLRELVDKNFVEIKAGALDRRRRQLYATPDGERLALRLALVQTRRFALGARPVGRLGAAVGASLSQGDDRSPEGARRRARPAGAGEAGRSGAMSAAPNSFQDDAAHVLVVDDDRRLRALLSSYLVKHGHRVTVAATAAKARAFLEGLAFDIIVLDVMMPVENGFDFAADLRGRSQVPILMLTARGEPQDRVRGLEIGVDDYLAKPFEPRELLLRIGSVLRRSRAAPAGSPEATIVRFGRFTFSLERGELRAGDEPVRITEREREMLRLLSANAGAIVSRDALSGSGGAAQERTVDVLVNRLRRKIEQDPANPIHLQTARGAGYRLIADR